MSLNEYYRKEFIQILDHQVAALSHNVKVAFDTVAPCISLLFPPSKEDPKQEGMDSLIELLPLLLQPNAEVLHVELTMFRQHRSDNMSDVKTLEDAACCAK